MRKKLDLFMENLKKNNPEANWGNLLTGIALIVMVAVFSYAYFSKTKESITSDNGNSLSGSPSVKNLESEKGGKDSLVEPLVAVESVVVEKGEGLWQVAQRACGDPEKYNILAQANGLRVWEGLNEGMTLKVVCE